MNKSLICLIAVSLWLLACSDSSSEPQKEEYDISGCCSGEWTIERIISINSLGDTINIRNGDSTYTNKGVCNPPPPSVMTFMCAETPSRFVDSVVIDSSISSSSAPLSSSSLFTPVPRSSSSYSLSREETIDSTREMVYRLLYPTPEGTLDTGFFATGECTVKADGSFECEQRSCIEDIGGRIKINNTSYPASYKDHEKLGIYFHTSTEKTQLIDINLGDSALTEFIPYANIPEFDTADALSRLAVLSAKTCTTLERFVGHYQLQAEGLPEGIILYRDGADIDKRQISTESYTMLFSEEDFNTVEKSVSDTAWLREHREELYSEEDYADYPYYAYVDPKYTAAINNFGCGVVSFSYEADPIAGYCHGWQVPDLEKEYSFRLINISDKVPETPFQWKLLYMDQYGRGGSLNVTTQFE